MNRRTQCQKVLDYLASGRTLTPLQALSRFKVMRLGARAYDLRKDGHDVVKSMVTTRGGARVAQYRLVK